MENTLNLKSKLMEAYNFWESNYSNVWSLSTKKSYCRTVESVEEYMISISVEPILENIDYKFIKNWENNLHEIYAEKSIKQKVAVMASLFNFLNKMGVVSSNEFAVITVSNNDNLNSHSRHLDIEELYEVFKTARHLEETEDVPILLPTLVALFTGFRNVTLTKLKVSTVNFQKNQLEFKLKNKDAKKKKVNKNINRPNSKIKELVVPLPIEVMSLIADKTNHLNNDANLLYGISGKPLANKQMNYITKLICAKLGWSKDTDKDIEHDMSFTPHGFRYSAATLFNEMGVSEQAIRHVLGHSHFEMGNLKVYIHTYNKQVKEIRAAQSLLATLLYTSFEIETKYNIKVNLKEIFESIDVHYTNAKLNNQYLDYFRSMIISNAIQEISVNMHMNHLNHQSITQPTAYFNTPVQHFNYYQQQMHMPNHNFGVVQSPIPFSNQYAPNFNYYQQQTMHVPNMNLDALQQQMLFQQHLNHMNNPMQNTIQQMNQSR